MWVLLHQRGSETRHRIARLDFSIIQNHWLLLLLSHCRPNKEDVPPSILFLSTREVSRAFLSLKSPENFSLSFHVLLFSSAFLFLFLWRHIVFEFTRGRRIVSWKLLRGGVAKFPGDEFGFAHARLTADIGEPFRMSAGSLIKISTLVKDITLEVILSIFYVNVNDGWYYQRLISAMKFLINSMYFLFARNNSDSINSIKVSYKHFNNDQYGRYSRENFSHKVPSKADSNRRENDFKKFADRGVKSWKKARREKIIWKPSSVVKAGRHNGVQGYP